MIEYIRSGDLDIAIFVPGTFSSKTTKFVTKNEEPLQWGIGVFAQGSLVEPHQHIGDPPKVSEFQEFIMIRRGRALAYIFNEADELIRQIEMGPGDALLLLRGGHGFDFLEETELLDLKQGPYLGREKMKRLILNHSNRVSKKASPQYNEPPLL